MFTDLFNEHGGFRTIMVSKRIAQVFDPTVTWKWWQREDATQLVDTQGVDGFPEHEDEYKVCDLLGTFNTMMLANGRGLSTVTEMFEVCAKDVPKEDDKRSEHSRTRSDSRTVKRHEEEADLPQRSPARSRICRLCRHDR